MVTGIFNLKLYSLIIALLLFVAIPLFAHAGTVNLSLSNTNPLAGESVTVTWTSSDTVRCVGTGFNTGGATNGSAVFVASGSGPQSVSILCFDDSPQCTVSATGVIMNEDAPGPNNCNPPTIQTWGTSCFPNGGTCWTSSPQGSTWRWTEYRCSGGCTTPSRTANYTVTAVPPPTTPTANISVTPTTVASGGSVTVSWSSTDTTSCAGSGFSTNGATGGSRTITNVTSNTTFRVTCQGVVTSPTPGTWQPTGPTPFDVIDLWCPLTRSNIQNGYSAVGTCPTSNHVFSCPGGSTFGCSATNSGDPTGLACTGSETCKITWANSCNVLIKLYQCNGGATPTTASDTARVTVSAPPPPPPTLSLSDNGPVTSGTAGRVTWNSTNATQCNFQPQSGGLYYGLASGGATSGSDLSSPITSDTPYTMRCTGPGGNITRNGTIRVAAVTPPSCTYTLGTNTCNPSWPDCGGLSAGDPFDPAIGTFCMIDDASTICPAQGIRAAGIADFLRCFSGPQPECNDGDDNDGNGTFDYPDDPGCSSLTDNDESSASPPPAPTVSASDNGPVISGNTAIVNWNSTDATSCVFTAGPGLSTGGATSGSDATSALTADAPYTIECTGAGGTDTFSDTINVTPAAAPFVTVSDNGPIISGSGGTVTWSGTNVTSCSFTVGSGLGLNTGGAISGTDGTSVGLTSDTPYTVECTGPGGTDSDSGVITIQPTPPPSLSVSDSGSVISGNPATVTWSATNASNCFFTVGNATGLFTGGSVNSSDTSDPLTSNLTYTLECNGPGGTDTHTNTITVLTPPTVTANDSGPVTSGSAALVTWSSTDTTSCSFTVGGTDGLTTGGSTNGSDNSDPLFFDAPYTVECTGPGGTDSDGGTILVGPGMSTLQAQIGGVPTATVVANDFIDLEWGPVQGTGVTCNGDITAGTTDGGWSGGPKTPIFPSGSTQFGIGPITTDGVYELNCTNGSGIPGQRTASITVLNPVAVVTAKPQEILSGRTTTISWEAQNVQGACELYEDGILVPSGSYTGTGYNSGTLKDSNEYPTPAITTTTLYRIECPVLPVPDIIFDEVTVSPFLPNFEEQ